MKYKTFLLKMQYGVEDPLTILKEFADVGQNKK